MLIAAHPGTLDSKAKKLLHGVLPCFSARLSVLLICPTRFFGKDSDSGSWGAFQLRAS